MRKKRVSFWTAAALLLTTASAAGAEGLPPGTVGLGGGGGYGRIAGDSRFGNDFGGGGAFQVLLRYAASRTVSLGFEFQAQNFSFDGTPVPGEAPPRSLAMTMFEGSLYYYRNRQADAASYLFLTAGLYRPEIRFDDEDALFPGENLTFSGGLGVELFLRENWALDLSGRAIGYVGDGTAFQEEGDPIPGGNFSFGFQGRLSLLYFILK